jgi:plastocyanin
MSIENSGVTVEKISRSTSTNSESYDQKPKANQDPTMKTHTVQINSAIRTPRNSLREVRVRPLRLLAAAAIVGSGLALCVSKANGATVTVTVGPGGAFAFSPSSVTIHRGDSIQWVWADDHHSSTSGTPNAPNGLWDSGILNDGATFSHTFNTVGSFPYFCTPHGACCGMTGTVTVTNTTATPTPPPVTGPPVVTTNPPTFVGSFSATLNASLNPHGLATSFHFQYGRTTAYGLTTAPRNETGNTLRNVTANIGSLTASTTYHFRIVASNADGTRMGADRVLTTLSMTGLPVVITNPASNVTASSATLHGALDPHGLTTAVHFQYGTTTSYGHNTANQNQSGNSYRNIAASLTGLAAHTTYHFRMVANNSAGMRTGADKTFTTP